MTRLLSPAPSPMANAGQVSNSNGQSEGNWSVVSHRRPIKQWQGCRLSFATLNAKHLVRSRDCIKSVELATLFQDLRWPSVVVVTETDGVAGKTDLVDKLGPRIAHSYDIRWTMRSVDKDGLLAPDARRMVGAGVALLVHKRLRVSIRDLSIPGAMTSVDEFILSLRQSEDVF